MGTLHRQTEPEADHNAEPENDAEPEQNADQGRAHTKPHKGCTHLIGITVRSTYPRKCRRRHFLGFNVRRYGAKLLIKPSTAAVKRIRRRLAAEMLALRGANALAVIRTLNPIVRGWSAYYRGVVSTETFQSLDHYLWRLTYKWALYRHNRRSKHRIIDRYYGRFHPSRRDRWVFGDRESGAFLTQFGWTKIVRHDMVKGRASPDGIELFNIASVPVTRYRYRGIKIPNPYMRLNHA